MPTDFKATQAEQSSAGPRKILDFSRVEKKWQAAWEDAKIFQAKETPKKRKFYNLEMFPYPSASFLHMGHVRNYTIGDIIARFKRMQGFNVLYPFGYDSFGLPAENAAKKAGVHPKKYTEDAIKKITEYLKALGNSYDWSRTIATHEPEYYKWNQWFFLKFLERGLVYRKKAPVNWCPDCNSTLANEEVVAGCCWRHETTQVQQKELEQWFIKTTAYADELLKDIDKLSAWSDRTKNLQRNWIGKSEGILIDFEIKTKLNFILLHGYTGSPKDNFFPWLKEELEKRGHKVSVPQLPNTNNPTVIEQAEYVLKHEKFDRNTVLLGHSLGGTVALKILEKLDKPIQKLVLAAGFAQPKFKDHSRPFENTFDWKFNFDKIRKNVREVFILRAKNDSAVPAERADYLREKLGGEIIDFEAEEEHICGDKEPVVLNNCIDKLQVFTTRPDTVFGVTFVTVSPKHPLIADLAKQNKNELEKLKSNVQSEEETEKEGVFLGSYAINPFTNEEVPVYAANFVVAEYGAGAVMAVPAHDQRDFEFARKYNIPIKVVITQKDKKLDVNRMAAAFIDEGILINSKQFDGTNSSAAIKLISDFAEKQKFGKRITQYKLRDWLVSRQRYWGTPIPIIYCGKCGAVPVPEKELPVLLPERVDFAAQGNPIKSAKSWIETKCPKCKSPAKRESDTMGGFVDSSWYFLRYCSPKEDKSPFEKKVVDYWMPVNQYIGGIEHAVGHLIYSRFWTKVLRDMKMLNFDEPFAALFNQGIVYKGGHKMSKSFGNVVYQTNISEKYGIDTARIFLMSVSAPESDMEWSDSGVEGSFRLLQKISKIQEAEFKKTDARDEHKRNVFIKNYTEFLETLKFNLAVIELAKYADYLAENPTRDGYETLLILLAPFAPHTAEELWHAIGKKSFVSVEGWPAVNEKAISKEIEQQEQTLTKIIQDVRQILKIVNTQAEQSSAGPRGKRSALEVPKKIYLYVIPKELDTYKQMVENLKKEFSAEIEVWANNNQSKYDPEHKSEKAKPGKPGIYLET